MIVEMGVAGSARSRLITIVSSEDAGRVLGSSSAAAATSSKVRGNDSNTQSGSQIWFYGRSPDPRVAGVTRGHGAFQDPDKRLKKPPDESAASSSREDDGFITVERLQVRPRGWESARIEKFVGTVQSRKPANPKPLKLGVLCLTSELAV